MWGAFLSVSQVAARISWAKDQPPRPSVRDACGVGAFIERLAASPPPA